MACSFLILIFYLFIKPSEIYIFETEKGTLSAGNTEKRFSPYSTFKLALSLFLSENKNGSKTWTWDGVKHPIETWNKNQTEESWIKNSCVWVSKKIIQQSSHEKIQFFLNNLNYGNKNVETQNFWLDETLKISVAEQITLLKKLLEKKEFKKDLFKVYSSKNGTVYGKTGTGQKGGWFIGWIEKNKKNYFFSYFKEKATGQESKDDVLKKLEQIFKQTP